MALSKGNKSAYKQLQVSWITTVYFVYLIHAETVEKEKSDVWSVRYKIWSQFTVMHSVNISNVIWS